MVIDIKNEIEQNYNIKIKKIYSNKKDKYFFINDKKVYIKNIDSEQEKIINELVNFTNELYMKKKNTETFLINVHGKYVMEYKNKKIALLISNNAENIELNFNDIQSQLNEKLNMGLTKYNIYKEWVKSIDDFEMKIIEYNKEFPKIMKYANYYIGLAENAIQLLEETEYNEEKNNYFGHLISENEYSYKNYTNPFSYIKTTRLYDVANYFKYKFYVDNIDYEELERVKKIIENENDKKIFLSLIIYPSEVIEKMKKIMSLELEENKLYAYLKKIKRLEEFIVYIQNNILEVKYIKWLEEQ